jgi:N-formylglutamate amidohydrolase
MTSPPTHSEPWTIERAYGPIVATAIHGGHDLRPEVARYMALTEKERLLEEDPHTGEWTAIGDSRVVVHRSRFEVDLNRPREKAVCLEPADCWGLRVWSQPPEHVVEESRRLHDRFYGELRSVLETTGRRWDRFVVLDLHSYNHRRDRGRPEDPAQNPDVNVGTGSVNREIWGALIDRFKDDLRGHEVNDRPLDVRENVKFKGAYLVGWVNSTFPQACALAIEVKKIFMDETTGTLDEAAWKEVHRALEAAAAGCRDELRR